MNIIHGVKTLPRLVGTSLSERMRVMPAIVVTGARQTGKSTLAEHLVTGQRRYESLDDMDVLDTARRDPEALVGGTACDSDSSSIRPNWDATSRCPNPRCTAGSTFSKRLT
jgi:hypothetical protein